MKNLQLFLDVVRRGSFAAAARARDIDPSSVSRAIGLLEHELGIRLFQRTTRQQSLTEAGRYFFSRMEGVVEEVEGTREELLAMQKDPAGTLRLTSSVAFGQVCLVPLLKKFQESFPRLNLECNFTDANLDMVAEGIDLAIRLGPPPSGDFVVRRLFATRYQVCASPGYIQEYGCPETPQALSEHHCLRFALPHFRSRWRFLDEAGEETQVPVSGKLVISNAMALRSCARQGLGPALLANWMVAEDLARGTLVDLFPHHEVGVADGETAAWLIYPSRSFLPAKVRLTMDFLLEYLSPRTSA